jgi:hypothetical protein
VSRQPYDPTPDPHYDPTIGPTVDLYASIPFDPGGPDHTMVSTVSTAPTITFSDVKAAMDEMLKVLPPQQPSYLEPGYVWAPYVPVLKSTPTFLDTFKADLLTKYAKKLVNPSYYGLINASETLSSQETQMADTNLKLVGTEIELKDGEKIGSDAWAKKSRARAKELAGMISTGFIELSKLLYQFYNLSKPGDPKETPLYKTWGYDSFKDYLSAELNMDKRRGERLRLLGYRLYTELEALDPVLRDKILALGESKVRELVRVLTLKNAEKWVELAEKSSYIELCAAIKKFEDAGKKKKAGRSKTPEGALGPQESKAELDEEESEETVAVKDKNGNVVYEVATTGGSVFLKGDHVVVEGNQATVKTKQAELAEDADEAGVVPEPAEEQFLHTFSLYKDQNDTVLAALERAKQLNTHDSPKSHLLSLICLDFLATNDFKKGDLDQTKRFLVRLEKALGLKFVAWDSDIKKIIYGFKTLDEMAATEAAHNAAEPAGFGHGMKSKVEKTPTHAVELSEKVSLSEAPLEEKPKKKTSMAPPSAKNGVAETDSLSGKA